MRLLLFCALALLPLAARAEVAAPDPTYLPELLERARARGLADGAAWRRLGHWRSGLLGTRSEADGPGLFLSPDGRRDPAAELDATLRAFFEPAPADPELEHAQCRFPARFALLARELSFDLARLPPRACPRFDEFWQRVQARSVTLVFSSYYMDRPSSAFGHTFMRLNKAALPDDAQPVGPASRVGARHELLDHGVDFAAQVDTPNALLYALKGLTGLFKGEFSARPYFYKVREYADYESRDLWEYDLALEPAEVAMLVAHLWELGHTWFDYWYLTENCSYHVLGAIEAAAPRLSLLEGLPYPVIPAETVKALYRNPGLVRTVRFRPSVLTQFERRAALLDLDEREEVDWLVAQPRRTPVAREPLRRALTLDAALDLYDVRNAKGVVAGEPAAVAGREALLLARAAIALPSPPLDVPAPALRAPHRGHAANRLSLGGGASTREGPFALLEWRAALHDLADPPAGFSPASQLEFLRLRLRWVGPDRHLRVDDATFVEATSLHHFDRFDRRFSWHLRAGAETVRDGGCDACLAAVAEVGAGPARFAFGDRLTLLLTGDAQLQASGALAGVNGGSLRVGVGPTATLRLLGARSTLLASAGHRWLPGAEPHQTFGFGAGGRLHLGAASVGAEWRRTPLAHEGLLLLQVFR